MNINMEDEEALQDYAIRNYQLKIINHAMQENAIVYLPTGSGKTLIAIKVLCNFTHEINKPYSQNGKRAFFITNTKVLALQLTTVLRTLTNFKTGCYTGDMLVDTWKKEVWMEQFKKFHVLVMTADILKQILQMGYISHTNISLIVFDECHHAVADHPFRGIMQTFDNLDTSEMPRILGLSAVILNSNIKKDQVAAAIQSLEATYRGKVVTESQIQEVLRFSTNPKEEIFVYKSDSYASHHDKVIQIYMEAKTVLSNILLIPSNAPDIPAGGKDFKNRNRANPIKNIFERTTEHLLELGTYCGSLSALLYIIYIEKHRLLSNDPNEILTLMYARTELNKARRIMAKAMGPEDDPVTIYRFSSSKVQKLIDSLKQNKEVYGENVSTLIFVEQRAKAMIIAFMLKRLSAEKGDFDFLKAEFVVGSSIFSKEYVFMETKNDEIIKRMSCRNLNTLVTTNILEEGIDLPSCNVVISFDFPKIYSSYFQSKGRARSNQSTYCVFIKDTEEEKKMNVLEEFRKIGRELFEVVTSNHKDEHANDSDDILEKLSIVTASNVIEVDGITATKIVNTYCTQLYQDKFSLLFPIVWYKNVDDRKQAFIKMPITCPLRDVIEGDVKSSIKLAKRSVFLKTLKLLYDTGELNDELYYIKKVEEKDFKDIFPHFINEKIDEKLPQPGTNKRKQTYKTQFAECLSGCMPQPDAKTYLHVLNFSLTFEKPDYYGAIYDLFQSNSTYGILSSKKLPQICQFPMFLGIGRINCNLLVNNEELILTSSELSDIKLFHYSLFKKVIRIRNHVQVFDNRNEELSFYVVPVEKTNGNKFCLNWDIIRCDFCKNTISAVVRYNPRSVESKRMRYENNNFNEVMYNQNTEKSLIPKTDNQSWLLSQLIQDRGDRLPKFEMTDAEYNFFVVSPSYRKVDPPQCYIVTKICHDLNPMSPFPKEKTQNFFTYYKEKYEIEITNLEQPLLKVKSIFRCSNFNKPRYEDGAKSQKSKDRQRDYEEHLVPELCDVFPFPCNFWLKALLLPTALNRIAQIYLVEEFRRRIARESGLGLVELPPGASWKPMEPDSVFFTKKEETIFDFTKLTGNKKSLLPLSDLKKKTVDNTDTPPLDAERHLFDVGLCDLEYYVNHIKNETNEDYEFMNLLEKEDEFLKLARLRDIKISKLSIFNEKGKNELGPELCDFVQATTAKSANDLFNYERLETLGDSFLKFSTSLYLFKTKLKNEGMMTSLKGKMVGNRNLLYCGLAKNLQNVINVTDFVPLSDWNPPLLRIPERLVNCIVSNKADSAVIYRLDIPPDENLSGNLSEKTYEENESIIKSYDKSSQLPVTSLLPYKIVSDKTVSDSVEALIGVYLEALGLNGAFQFLICMGILPETATFKAMMEEPYQFELFNDGSYDSVLNILGEVFYPDLEKTLDYTFKNKGLLLEALTHPSYVNNRVTSCYQKLEFLGDSILDFLITSYIYDNCSSMTPGQITDVRSSLVNNITFACLTVRYGFHKYLLSLSSALNKVIESFVHYQVSRNHTVDESVLILLEEEDGLISDTVQIPKALGDVFEAIAGAIFLDSGNSLETVWRVYYKLMKREIDEFTKTIPKTSFRLLQEICGEKPYCEVKTTDDRIMVTITTLYDNHEITVHGFGANKKDAKRSAAKFALKKILELRN